MFRIDVGSGGLHHLVRVHKISNYLGFPFTIGVVTIFLTWIAKHPNAIDVEWFKRGGHCRQRSSAAVPLQTAARRRFTGSLFSAAALWQCASCADVLYGTAIELHAICPSDSCRGGDAVHGGHARAYLHRPHRSEGAFEAMGEGTVDVNWAKEHHISGSRMRWRASGRPVEAATNGDARPKSTTFAAALLMRPQGHDMNAHGFHAYYRPRRLERLGQNDLDDQAHPTN